MSWGGKMVKQATNIAPALIAAAVLAGCDMRERIPTTPVAEQSEPSPAAPEQVTPKSMVWNWTNQDSEGWQLHAPTGTVYWPDGGGMGLLAASDDEFPDVAIRSPVMSINGADFPKIVVELETVVPGVQPDLHVFYQTPEHGESIDFRAAALDASLPLPNEPRVLVYDMTALAAGDDDWTKSTITSVRFDLPQGANSNHIVRELRICYKDDMSCFPE